MAGFYESPGSFAARLGQAAARRARYVPISKVYTTFFFIGPTQGRTFMPSPKDSYDFHDQVGHLLRRAYQHHVSIFQEAIPDSDLTAAQFVTLCAVKEKQGCSLNDIVKATAIDQATIRGVVERLKTRALIEVLPDPKDGRKLLVRATPTGLALIERTVPFAKQVTERTYGPLNAGERVALLFLLRKMMETDGE